MPDLTSNTGGGGKTPLPRGLRQFSVVKRTLMSYLAVKGDSSGLGITLIALVFRGVLFYSQGNFHQASIEFANGEYVGTGLSLIVDKKNEDCPYLRLEQIFRDVIKETKNGWRVATDEERERATYYPMDRRTFQSKKDDYLIHA